MIKPIKLGVLSDEFFALDVGARQSRLGGFGWAARQVARCFHADPARGVEVVYLTGEIYGRPGERETIVHDTRLILRQPSRLANALYTRAEHFDLLLTIDYNLDYRFLLRTMPRTPVIVWARDPRPPADQAKIDTLQIPGALGQRPQGCRPLDATSLAGVVAWSHGLGRPFFIAATAPRLAAQRVPGAYGIASSEITFLPNPIDLPPEAVVKNPIPRVVFLGRLDPIKRPWLFVRLAELFPHVEFLFLGRAHFHGAGSWEPHDLPPNVRRLGHVDGPAKQQLLSSAWVTVNTSIHEALPVSFLEALACETPILSCQDPEEIVSHYGIFVGRWDGDGLDSLPAFAGGLRRLLDDATWRAELGRRGREWVAANHGPARFHAAFDGLCRQAGLER